MRKALPAVYGSLRLKSGGLAGLSCPGSRSVCRLREMARVHIDVDCHACLFCTRCRHDIGCKQGDYVPNLKNRSELGNNGAAVSRAYLSANLIRCVWKSEVEMIEINTLRKRLGFA
jgi:hypothetical protein